MSYFKKPRHFLLFFLCFSTLAACTESTGIKISALEFPDNSNGDAIYTVYSYMPLPIKLSATSTKADSSERFYLGLTPLPGQSCAEENNSTGDVLPLLRVFDFVFSEANSEVSQQYDVVLSNAYIPGCRYYAYVGVGSSYDNASEPSGPSIPGSNYVIFSSNSDSILQIENYSDPQIKITHLEPASSIANIDPDADNSLSSSNSFLESTVVYKVFGSMSWDASSVNSSVLPPNEALGSDYDVVIVSALKLPDSNICYSLCTRDDRISSETNNNSCTDLYVKTSKSLVNKAIGTYLYFQDNGSAFIQTNGSDYPETNYTLLTCASVVSENETLASPCNSSDYQSCAEQTIKISPTNKSDTLRTADDTLHISASNSQSNSSSISLGSSSTLALVTDLSSTIEVNGSNDNSLAFSSQQYFTAINDLIDVSVSGVSGTAKVDNDSIDPSLTLTIFGDDHWNDTLNITQFESSSASFSLSYSLSVDYSLVVVTFSLDIGFGGSAGAKYSYDHSSTSSNYSFSSYAATDLDFYITAGLGATVLIFEVELGGELDILETAVGPTLTGTTTLNYDTCPNNFGFSGNTTMDADYTYLSGDIFVSLSISIFGFNWTLATIDIWSEPGFTVTKNILNSNWPNSDGSIGCI